MRKIIYLALVGLFTFFIINLLTINIASARPGGGHSYNKSKSSSRSSSSSSSSYSSDKKKSSNSYSDSDEDNEDRVSDYVFDYVNIDYEYEFSEPDKSNNTASSIVFWSLGAILVGAVKIKEIKDKKKKLVSQPTLENKLKTYKRNINNLNKLTDADPNFSQTLFLDFASSVFTKYKSWLGKKEFINLIPFVLPKYVEYAEVYTKAVSGVVIGSINISNITIKDKTQNVFVEIDANYTVKEKDFSLRMAVIEKWKFSRKAGILSPEPEKMRELSCPACGSNDGFTSIGECESCGIKIENGEKQWCLSSHTLVSSNSFKTDNLAYYADEAGTEIPTIYQATLDKNIEKFTQNHKLNWVEWNKRFEKSVVHNYFTKLYAAWSVKKLDNVRNLLSDLLYDSWMFWIDNYTKEGLTNKLDNVKIEKVEFVKMDIDKYYETATVRIKASCKDYVIDKKGKVAGGSKRKKRKFSEYWTFIRRTGVETDTYDYATCPNCGAPADKMGQSGICEYCSTKISNGDFSWVLSVITQDEVYKG